MKIRHPVIGGLLLASSMACFSISDAIAKSITGLSAIELTWWRYAALLLTVLPLAAFKRGSWRTARPGLQFARALALVASAILFLTGLQLIPLAEVTSMVFCSPLFVTLLGMTVLREPMTIQRWMPVLIGFAGVLVVVRPGSLHFGGAEVFPISSSLAWAVSVICTRKVSASDSSTTTTLYSAAFGTLVLTLILGGIDLRGQAHALPQLLPMALAWAAAQWLVIAAYHVAAPSAIAPFSFSQLIWAGLLGYIVFGHVPDGLSLLGMGVILISGLYAAWLAHASMRPHHA